MRILELFGIQTEAMAVELISHEMDSLDMIVLADLLVLEDSTVIQPVFITKMEVTAVGLIVDSFKS